MLPEGWEEKKLGEVIDLAYGKALTDSQRKPGAIPVFGSSGIVGTHTESICKGPGIVVGRKGTVGSVIWSDSDFWVIDTAYYVDNKAGNFLRWLFYKLQHLRLDRLNESSGVPGLNRNNAAASKILVPPYKEQQEIAEILIGVDEAIEATRAVIGQTGRVKNALMSDLLTRGLPGRHKKFKPSPLGEIPEGWDVKTLGEICESLQTGPFGSLLHASEYTAAGVPVVMPKDIIGHDVDEDTVARVPEEVAKRLSKYRVTARDIIFSRRGDLGRFVLVKKEQEGWLCGTGCLIARLKQDIHPEFIISILVQAKTVEWLESNAVGQTMPNLNTGILSKLPLPIPPVEEQKTISEMLISINKQARKNQENLMQLQKLKSALTQVLLTGKVRVSVSGKRREKAA